MSYRTPLDVNDPEFPHGTTRGYAQGCTRHDECPERPSCWTAKKRQRFVSEARARNEGPNAGHPAQPVIDHFEYLRTHVPEVSLRGLFAAIGMDQSASAYYYMCRTGTTSRTFAKRFLALTVEDALETRRWVPAADVRSLVRQLQAQGFSLEWQMKTTGRSTLRSLFLAREMHPGRKCRRDLYEDLKQVYDALGGRMATPEEDGLTSRAIGKAKTVARRDGFHPSTAYSDDGTLDLRALPNHPWAEADDRCAAIMDLAHAIASLGNRAEAIRSVGDRPGVEQLATRIISRLGITFTYTVVDEVTGKTNRFVYEPHEARQVNGEVFELIETTWQEYDDGFIGPVYAALTVGLASVRSRGNGTLPRDHPEVLEYAADHQEAEENQDDMATAA